MSSSIGRLALGVVGALIGAPFGLAAVGFAIGSTIGGFIFAPEGPSVEGPRLGDTDVTASSLGKVIPFHYGGPSTAVSPDCLMSMKATAHNLTTGRWQN